MSDCLSLVNTQGKALMNIKNQRISKVFEDLQEFNYKFMHTPGSCNSIADALSRAPVEEFFEEDDTDNEDATDNIFVSTANHDEVGETDTLEDLDMTSLRLHIAKDDAYQQIIEAFKQDIQPKTLSDNHPAKRYNSIWNSISLMDNTEHSPLIIDGDKLLVPDTFGRKQAIDLHEGTHATIPQMERSLAAQVWSTKSHDITTTWASCDDCIKEQICLPEGRDRTDKIPLTSIEPMTILHMDLLQWSQKHYLAIRDHCSTYTWMSHLVRPDSSHVLEQLDVLQKAFGRTSKIVSDNGSNLVSEQINRYCQQHNIVHETSSPYNPTSNSKAELGVKKCKFALRRSKGDFKQAQSILHQSQAQVKMSDCDSTPLEIFLKRRIKYNDIISLNVFRDNKTSDWNWNIEMGKREAHRLERLKVRVAHQKPNTELKVGQKIIIQHPISLKWSTEVFTVHSSVPHRDSYTIQASDGSLMRRHRRFIRPHIYPDEVIRRRFNQKRRLDYAQVPLAEPAQNVNRQSLPGSRSSLTDIECGGSNLRPNTRPYTRLEAKRLRGLAPPSFS